MSRWRDVALHSVRVACYRHSIGWRVHTHLTAARASDLEAAVLVYVRTDLTQWQDELEPEVLQVLPGSSAEVLDAHQEGVTVALWPPHRGG